MLRRLIPAVLAAALAGCGGSAPDVPGDADPDDVAVIRAWADTLRSGDIDGAAEFFAIPSIAENGVLVPIEDEDDARLFNASLPCGAELVGAHTEGEFTTATFRLTERPGRGVCGAGTGTTAQTAFVIEHGLIVEWRRVGLPSDVGSRRSA